MEASFIALAFLGVTTYLLVRAAGNTNNALRASCALVHCVTLFLLIAASAVAGAESPSGQKAVDAFIQLAWPLIVNWCCNLVLYGIIAYVDRKITPLGKSHYDVGESPETAIHTLVMTEANGPALQARTVVTPSVQTPVVPDLFDTNVTVIRIKGDITPELAERVWCEAHVAKDHSNTEVRVELVTVGGFYDDAYQIRAVLQELARHKKVSIYVVGNCMSAGVSILCALPVEQRIAMRHATFMIHASSGDNGRQTQSSRLSTDHITKDLLRETNISEKSLRNLMKSRMMYCFSSEKAQELGLVCALV